MYLLSCCRPKQGVGLPRKYLGHGICDARSKLLNLGRATADEGTLKSHALQLLREAKIPPGKIRGIGLQMTRLGPVTGGDGGGVGDGAGVGADGGPFGALHGWLIKPGDGEEGGDSSTKSAASTTPTKTRRITAVDEHASPSSRRKRTEGGGALSSLSSSSSPTVPKRRGGSSKASSRSLHSPAVSGNVDGDPTESDHDQMAVFQRQDATMSEAAAGTAAASPGPHRSHKHPRAEGEQNGDAAPSNARPSPRRRSDAQSVVSVASTTSTSTFAAKVGAGPATADAAAVGVGIARSLAVPGSARKRKVAWTDHLGEAEPAEYVPSSTSAGGGATPSRNTEREQEGFGGADSSQQGGGSGPSLSPAPRRLTNHALPDSPEFLSPPTPAERVMATTSTGAVGSPSMSQVRRQALFFCGP